MALTNEEVRTLGEANSKMGWPAVAADAPENIRRGIAECRSRMLRGEKRNAGDIRRQVRLDMVTNQLDEERKAKAARLAKTL